MGEPEVLLPRRIVRMNLVEERFEYLEKKGLIFCDSEIDEGMPSVIALTLFKLHFELDKNATIWMILNSPGGQVDQGFAIFDTVRALTLTGRKINILCIGCVASMATCVLQAATQRYSLLNTQFLIHEISQHIHGVEKVSEGEDRVTENKRINNIVMGIIAERAGIATQELIKVSKKKDYWLDAKGALKFGKSGLIDKIVDKLPFL